ncbi:hydroxymethylglutaryl-CoA reductase, degradative [Enterococcus sp. ALS3]|uniref:Acetoacetyl-CoA thiolase n=1 Tax=Enterococcus alishanensis TaxID=1303817 RepID=A0ABS6TA54_9ENTE|nr:hydroxymethylglutaryl-CoA reductase, degradative [Enterococcus alishanensis]MBV7389765.1 hydroxymethylglutaryl-CoA reductase, degradative [Enterococcus alishanensis]
MEEVVILSAVRTPIGKYKGTLATVSSVDLAAITISEAVKRSNVKNQVDQVILGNVLQAGSGQNVARQASIKAGLGNQVPAMTINEVCGSGLKSIILAMQQIQLGRAQLVVAGGTENMSQAPKLTKFDFETESYQEPISSMIYDGLTDAFSGEHMGLTAEKVSERFGVTSQMQDKFAYDSQKKAHTANISGKFSEEIVPVHLADGTVIEKDEGIRENATLEKMSSLKPAFKEEGTVTAANASTLNDGASALVLAAKSYAIANQLPFLAEIEDYAEVGIDPSIMGVAPIDAINKLLQQRQMTTKQVDLFEINEAFAASSVAVERELALPRNKVNIYGGGIALGHPIGASGARIVTTLLSALKDENKERGIASLCIGGGLGLAIMLKKKSLVKEDKFYRLSTDERINQLLTDKKIQANDVAELKKMTLSEKIADNLIENQISEVELPLGVAQNFVVNGEKKLIPMATEEPSVIAAASNAAKLVSQAGGFKTKVLSRKMIGQIVFNQLSDFTIVEKWLTENRLKIFDLANQAYPSIVTRGGGLTDLKSRRFKEKFFSIDLTVDVKDAMGANMVNTVLEAVANEIQQAFPQEELLFSILSNYGTEALVEATCQIPFEVVSEVTAKKIAAAGRFAKLDPYRAATHNKGIMNGIDAVVLATGNDTRAVAAACHAYASRNGSYQGLTDWWIEDDTLNGRLIVPMNVGIVGGATKVLPKAALSLKLLAVDSAQNLSENIVAVGLAQNLAAVKALVTDGIQKGHMALHSRTLAINAGAKDHEIDRVVQLLKQTKVKNLEQAKAILAKLRE